MALVAVVFVLVVFLWAWGWWYPRFLERARRDLERRR